MSPARAHLGAHTSARTHGHTGWHPHLARALPPTFLCPRAHTRTHTQTQTRADTLTADNFAYTHSRTHELPAPPGTESENCLVFPNSSPETRLPRLPPRLARGVPSLAFSFLPSWVSKTGRLVAMTTQALSHARGLPPPPTPSCFHTPLLRR